MSAHTDPNEITATDWIALVALLPPAARAAFRKERDRQSEQEKRLLEAFAAGTGGLTTYDPEHAGWIECERLTLESLARYVASCDLYSRQRTLGVVDAARQIAEQPARG